MFWFRNETATTSVFDFECSHSIFLFAPNGTSEILVFYTYNGTLLFQVFVKLIKIPVLAETDIQYGTNQCLNNNVSITIFFLLWSHHRAMTITKNN
jgi:hypothetical protein